jgi:putative acetyltransferase
MQIRAEIAADEEAISSLITAAFRGAEHSGGNESEIVDKLRKAGSLTVSLVAIEDRRIVGHVAFSPVATATAGSDLVLSQLRPAISDTESEPP